MRAQGGAGLMKMVHEAGQESLTGALLQSVSRSFFLTIRWLPHQMQDGIALGYLLARATDSVADTSSADAEKREAILRLMGEAIGGNLSAEAQKDLFQQLGGALALAQEKEAERVLLSRFGECISLLQQMPVGQIALIRKVLQTIVEGQLWDLTYFRNNPSVTDDEQTHRYTFLVAGCVGRFWTELGLETMGSQFCLPARRQVMEEAGIRYGCGLQLVNILRDEGEDAARGRRYLCTSRSQWMNRAERYLHDGVDYSTRLRRFRLRFASMLPALIGLKTLARMRQCTSGERVKIPRRTVYGCMLKAVWLSLVPRAF